MDLEGNWYFGAGFVWVGVFGLEEHIACSVESSSPTTLYHIDSFRGEVEFRPSEC